MDKNLLLINSCPPNRNIARIQLKFIIENDYFSHHSSEIMQDLWILIAVSGAMLSFLF